MHSLWEFGRTPTGVTNTTCEAFLLDLSIQNLTAVPAGAEVAGAIMTPNGKSILVNGAVWCK
jgi:uncharacterized protein